tara:strand:+ start:785 stop:976 length:192 start_codon:yes stop_codon:yes gene_type:complete
MSEYSQRYYAKHRDKILAHQKEYNKLNRERIRHYNAHYWLKKKYGYPIPPFKKEEYPIILYFD